MSAGGPVGTGGQGSPLPTDPRDEGEGRLRRVAVDVGGTFTDLAMATDDGGLLTHKVPSTAHPSQALVSGLTALAERLGLELPAFVASIDLLVYGTTVATNAVLTRSGAVTGLLTNAGLRDTLQMRGGVRERPFDNWYVPPPPLVPRNRRLGITGRVDRSGAAAEPLDVAAVERAAAELSAAGVTAIAICYMHSYANPGHERETAEAVRRLLGPGCHVTASVELLPKMGFEDRVNTTVLNAYVGPLMRDHLADVAGWLRACGFRGAWLVMQSNGGMITPEVAALRAALSVLSGPSAAPSAAARYAGAAPSHESVCIDMGGTSCDVALLRGGRALVTSRGAIGGLPVALPMVDIVTVGAGGGSVAWVDQGGLLRVGPRSAGAVPGPACYGRGGTLPTCTDANLVLGHLRERPAASTGIALRRELAWQAIEREVAGRLSLDVTTAARGIVEVAVSCIAAAIREVTIERGLRPGDATLVAGGGAGPLYCAAVAEELDMTVVVVPQSAATLSAIGMLVTDVVHDIVVAFPFHSDRRRWASELGRLLRESAAEGERVLAGHGLTGGRVVLERSADVRYRGQFHEVSVALRGEGSADTLLECLLADFHLAHAELYGYSVPADPVEVVNLRTRAIGRPGSKREPLALDPAASTAGETPGGRREVVDLRTGRVGPIAELRAGELAPGARYPGPAVVEMRETSLLVPEGWALRRSELGSLVLRRGAADGAA